MEYTHSLCRVRVILPSHTLISTIYKINIPSKVWQNAILRIISFIHIMESIIRQESSANRLVYVTAVKFAEINFLVVDVHHSYVRAVLTSGSYQLKVILAISIIVYGRNKVTNIILAERIVFIL